LANKKPRTPQPPRGGNPPPRVQAPRTRRDDVGRRHGKLLYWIAGGGAVVLVAVVLAVVLGGGGKGGSGGSKNVASLMAAAGCTYKDVPGFVPKGQGTHVANLTAKLPWNTSPPSNGQHYPLWAVWGFYTQAVNPRMVVHNEEHGGVIEWWGSQVPQSTVAQLKAFYDEQPDGGFGTPYPSLGSKIAITAWTGDTARYQQNGYYGEGHIGTCPSYTAATKKAFEAFRKAYRGKGPEGIPLSADEPGMGPQSQ
jgi:hypothetical protein